MAVIETLDVRRLLSASLGGEHTHEHEISPIDPALVNVWAPLTVSLTQPGSYLTPARKGDPARIARDATTIVRSLLQANAPTLGTSRAAVTQAEVTDRYTDSMSGLTHVYFRQVYNGLPVLNAVANGSVDATGRVLTAAANFILPTTVTKAVAREVTSPKVSALDAVGHVAEELGIELGGLGFAGYLGEGPPPKAKAHLSARVWAPGLQEQPIETNLVYVATGERKVELAWRMVVELESGSHWYELAVSAKSGEVIFAADYVSHATYNVYGLPTKAPNDGPRVLRVDPHDPIASPFGWHDTDGVAGPEFTTTRGNNVHAYLDRDNNNQPDATVIDGGPNLIFNPAIDLSQAPTTITNQQAALTNLFYVNNRIHDITYRYGFTEVAGNFQTNNYGRGGLGNDAVRAEAQDGGGTNNANFATPADGSAPRMQMYLWTQTTPQRDGDLDNLIVIHEYTHGISNRLTGGPSNSSALNAIQSGGMGEGWSDFLSLMLTQKPTDTATQAIGMGTYSLGQPTNGVGIRRFPYSTDMSISPLTIGSYNSTQAVHRTGEVWCATLWDLNWALIGAHGPTADLSAGYTGPASGGSALTLQLVMDGMKLQPANPTLFQARDAILQADLNLTGGANQGLIWQTFARRGFGFSASTASASSTSLVEAFDVPSPFPSVRLESLVQTAVSPVSSIRLAFTKSIDTTTFSVADDLISLTGPDGNSLRSAITGTNWSAGDTVLTFQLTTQTRVGAYNLVLGPNIASKDTGLLIDQNLDGIGGTLQDNVTVVLNYNPYLGPDGSGYQAGAALFEPLDLVVGQPGVIDTGLSADDGAIGIPLGSNTFNFYGTTYTAGQLFANSNGLLTFTSSSTAYTNTDLTTSPTQAAIAPLWDDWRTDVNANDRLLYRFDDLTGDGIANRLIIEWSEVINYSFTSSPATFQAILELNTGSRPGSITFNYPDLNVGSSGGNDGASATVGIKASGTAAANRLLVSRDNGSGLWAASGKAVRIGLDVAPPEMLTASATEDRLARVLVQMSEPVRVPAVSSFTLEHVSTGSVMNLATATVSVNATTGELTLATGIKLPDGQYRLTAAAGSLEDLAGNRTLIATSATFRVGDLGPTGPRPLSRGLPPAADPRPAAASLTAVAARPTTSFFSTAKVGPLADLDPAELAV